MVSSANTSNVSVNSSDENLAQCREVFLYFDTKGDEKITVTQVGDVLRAMGQNPTQVNNTVYSHLTPSFQSEIQKCCEHWSANPSGSMLFKFYDIDSCRYAHLVRGLRSHLSDDCQEPFEYQLRGIVSILVLGFSNVCMFPAWRDSHTSTWMAPERSALRSFVICSLRWVRI
jgi:hypothetical protein